LDERDFAELISVFLKGNEPDDSSKEKKGDGGDKETSQSVSETELRKNIIEALAEKIKETQESQPEDFSVGAMLEEAASAEEIMEEAPSIEEAVEEVISEEPANIEEDLVTDEEVSKLLSDSKPSEDASLHHVLSYLTDLDGVTSALVVSRDGFIVDHVSNVKFELDMVSAVVATGFNILDKIGQELKNGEFEAAMIEYANGPVVISPLVEDIMLVVTASSDTTLGRIRWEVKKQKEKIVANL